MRATTRIFSWILAAAIGWSGQVMADDAAEPVPAPDSQPAAKSAPAKGKEAPAKEQQAVEVREDRIKSVQRKAFLKRHRFELSPTFTLSLNDAFYQKVGIGVSAAFSPADALTLELHGAWVTTIETDMVSFFRQANQALPRVSYLRGYFLGDILWSPLYGKLSMFTDDIVMFDAYLIGGFGLAVTETGVKLATNVGLGLRYFLTSWLVIKLEVRDLIYTETLTVSRTQFSDVQNHVILGLGASFFLPVDFDYEYQ